MEQARFKVKSPNLAVHETVRALVGRRGRLILENPRRLSLSIADPAPELLTEIERIGASVVPDERYEPDLDPTAPKP